LGVVAQIVAVVWMVVIYLKAVRAVTGLDWGHSAMAMLLPAAILSVLGFAFFLAAAATLMRMIF
jgi:hypothetical protein